MSTQPNIILIHTDQHRGDCLSINNHPVVQTPNIDHLAYSGAQFTSAYTECPTCIPARHTLLTGMEPQATGVVGFEAKARIERTESTLPELLRRSGYQTVLVGRSMHQYPGHKHYGFEIMDGDPFKEHYSRFHNLSIPGGNHMGKINWPHNATHGLGVSSMCARPWPYDEEFHETNFATNKAIEYLFRRDKDRPLFMAVGFTAPHPPFIPPQVYYDRYMQMDIPEPVIGDWAERPENNGRGLNPGAGKQVLEGAFMKQARAAYYALINHIDDQLHLLFDQINQNLDNTYIFFVSDHGEMLGDHYFCRKALPYDASSRIPFILKGPSISGKNKVEAPVGLQDILPTCCEIAGIETPEHVTGRSVLALARGKQDNGFRSWIHGEHAPMGDQHPGVHYLTDGKRKFIWFNDGSEQFFDLENDPSECHNLINDSNRTQEISVWRERLIKKLEGRPEGFSDGTQLTPSNNYKNANTLARVDA